MHFSRFRRYLAAQRYLYLIFFVVAVGSAYPLVADFYTKGEPREALVSRAMLEEGTYILPKVYAEETAYKPPMFHWLEAGTAALFTDGHVTPLSARLPSAVAIFAIAAAMFLFFSQRRGITRALLASLIFLTTLDPHRFGIIARVDMVLTAFIVLNLFGLYVWGEERSLRGIPWSVVLLMSGGFLTKGPVGVLLPLLIFVIFAVLRRYPVGRTLLKAVSVGLLASIIPLIWYFLAWQKGGEPFLQLVWNENFLRFLGIKDESLFYGLGHEGSLFKPVIYFILGLIPWTLLAFFVRWDRKRRSFSSLSPVQLFALVAALTTLLFYMIPMSKSSSYLLPMYPFAALWAAEELYLLVRKSDSRLRGFALLMSAFGVLLLLAMIALQFGLEPSRFGFDGTEVFAKGLRLHFGLTLFGELLLVVGLLTILYQMLRKNAHKLAFSIIFLAFILHFNIDVPVMSYYKEANSARPFAEKAAAIVGEEPLYVVSDIRDGYLNLYGFAFYSGKRPIDLETADPAEGYLAVWEKDFERLRSGRLRGYSLEIVAKDDREIKEGGRTLLLSFRKIR